VSKQENNRRAADEQRHFESDREPGEHLHPAVDRL
jgi:hypothetical protein